MGGEIDAWLLANVVPTGKSPEISLSDCKRWASR